MDIFRSEPNNWYLSAKGGRRRQWFSETPLEAVLGMAMLMTGAGDLSAADEVTLEDGDQNPIVTFVALEGHKGNRLSIPPGSATTPDDLVRLHHFMYALQLSVSEPGK